MPVGSELIRQPRLGHGGAIGFQEIVDLACLQFAVLQSEEGVRADGQLHGTGMVDDRDRIVKVFPLLPIDEFRLPAARSAGQCDVDIDNHELMLEKEFLQFVGTEPLGQEGRIGNAVLYQYRNGLDTKRVDVLLLR